MFNEHNNYIYNIYIYVHIKLSYIHIKMFSNYFSVKYRRKDEYFLLFFIILNNFLLVMVMNIYKIKNIHNL